MFLLHFIKFFGSVSSIEQTSRLNNIITLHVYTTNTPALSDKKVQRLHLTLGLCVAVE